VINKKKESKLAVDVKISLASCTDWASFLEQKKTPETLLNDIKAKSEVLKNSMIRELLWFAAENDKKHEKLRVSVEATLKTPLQYYQDGKSLLNEKKIS